MYQHSTIKNEGCRNHHGPDQPHFKMVFQEIISGFGSTNGLQKLAYVLLRGRRFIG
jgi:hypothetical protein